MTLDPTGILAQCEACGATNRLKYGSLEKPTRCGKCKATLPLPSEPIEVPGTAEFDAAISASSLPILVDFWAVWCGPCHAVAPEIDKLAQRMSGQALVLKLDTDAQPELSQRYQVRSIPTLAVFQNGQEVERTTGAQSAANLEVFLRRHVRAA